MEMDLSDWESGERISIACLCHARPVMVGLIVSLLAVVAAGIAAGVWIVTYFWNLITHLN
ncbi:MAG TPA: hypothetical protein VFX16_25425 [Pseudonocardiaceae bacterium]|nr:hypothetical protein [Pseudonocardiaceae bacterium]